MTELAFNHSFADTAASIEPFRSPGSLKRADTLATKHQELEAAAKNFEGIFVHQILKQMQETIENASFDPDDNAGKQVHSMYSTFMADAIAQQGGFGMWEQIYDQLLQSERLGKEPVSQTLQLDEKA